MARCPVRKLDKGACVDFSTRGLLVNDKFRDGWDKVFGKEVKDGGLRPVSRPSTDKRS